MDDFLIPYFIFILICGAIIWIAGWIELNHEYDEDEDEDETFTRGDI